MRSVEYEHLNSPLKLCECGCGEKIHTINRLGRPAKFKQGHYARGIRGPAHSQWKGGIRYRFNHGRRYRIIWTPKHHYADHQGYVLEHRLIWEKHNNAILLPWADVHHKDNNPLNNACRNLEAMLRGEHSRYHRKYQVEH